jgi:hypothetical protein
MHGREKQSLSLSLTINDSIKQLLCYDLMGPYIEFYQAP